MPTTEIPPRILRYHSTRTGGPAFGLVLAEADGIPTRVLSLTAREPRIGSAFDTFLRHDGFTLADRVWGEVKERDAHAATDAETIRPKDVLPPVDISDEDIRLRRKFILSMGLNYESHRQETNRGADLIMINATGTTGPYDPLTLTPEADLPDYEAEVGAVLLRDVDLAAIPSMSELEPHLAYFATNDFTDRAPIILDEKAGYTASKSDPGYVTIGPWMVAGRHLPVFTQQLGLEIALTVTRSGGEPEPRQRDTTAGVIRNPEAILRLLAEKLAADPAMAHPDRHGVLHPFARVDRGRAMLPAGSLILTGTPGGTCIRPPGLKQKISLLLRSGFYMPTARKAFVQDCVRGRVRLGYLVPGDTVEMRATGLGRQVMPVR